MAENFDSADSILVCDENTDTRFNDDPDCDVVNETGSGNDPCLNSKGSNCLVGFALLSEESVREMVEKEKEHLLRDDYLKRLRSGDLDLSVREEAYDWIRKVCGHYHFGPLCLYLSLNYLDRFLSAYELPRDKSWTVQLVSVACLSLAAKMDETEVPQSLDLQVGDPRFVFEAKTIQRMELLILNTLKWRLAVLTPFSFIDYFLSKVSNFGQCSSPTSLPRSVQLILSTIRGAGFLEFRPSELAAAVAIRVIEETKAVDIDEAISSFTHVEKERVVNCLEMIKGLSAGVSGSVSQSLDGVSGVTCLRYKTDDRTVGSCTNSSYNTPENKTKRMKHESQSL